MDGVMDTIDNRTVAEMAKEYWIYDVSVWISLYYIPIIVPIGIVGNILSFLVMTMPHNRTNSCCNFMAALAISDNCMMYVGLHLWALTPGLTRPVTLNECRFLSYCFNTFTIIGVYFIVFMTIDRFIAVRFPLQSVRLCTTKRARITIAATCIIIGVYGLGFILTIDVLHGALCSGIGLKTDFSVVFSWINAMVGSFIPFLIIIVMNTLIIITLRHRKKDQRILTRTTSKENSDVQLVVMLMLVSFAFLFLTFPICIRYILANVIDHNNNAYHNAVYTFLYHLTQKLSVTNNAVNFYLYCIGGAKFRSDLRKLCNRKGQERKASTSNFADDVSIATISQITKL